MIKNTLLLEAKGQEWITSLSESVGYTASPAANSEAADCSTVSTHVMGKVTIAGHQYSICEVITSGEAAVVRFQDNGTWHSEILATNDHSALNLEKASKIFSSVKVD